MLSMRGDLQHQLNQAALDDVKRTTITKSIIQTLILSKNAHLGRLAKELNITLERASNKEKVVVTFGKDIRKLLTQNLVKEKALGADGTELQNDEKELQAIDRLLFHYVDLHLHNLDLFDLDQEIEAAKNKVINQPQFEYLITSLDDLRETIASDLDKQKTSRKNYIFDGGMLTTEYLPRKEILKSNSCKLAKDATTWLNASEFTPQSRVKDKAALETFTKTLPEASNRATNFFKAAWSVVTASLVGLLGVPFLVVGGYFGFILGKDLGKWGAGIKAHESIVDNLTFKATPAIAAKKVSEVAATLFAAPAPRRVKKLELLNEQPTYQPAWYTVKG